MRRQEEEEIAGEGVVDTGDHRVRPRREVNEIRGVYGPEQQRDPEGRHMIAYRKCQVVVREGISVLALGGGIIPKEGFRQGHDGER